MEDLFESANGDYDIQKKHINNKGCPVVSAGENNNGIIGKTDVKAKIFSANTITVDMFGNTYYQRAPYKMVTHARVFSLAPIGQMKLSEKIGLFVIANFQYLKQVYSYNNMCSWEKLRKQRLSLPSTENGNIDFSFIEERMRELEEERVRELEAYIQEAGFEDCTLTKGEKDALNAIECRKKLMRKFDIVKEFKVANSHNILRSDVVFGSGTTPYVTAIDGNNSIVTYISYKPDMMEQGNSIMIGGKTLVITYQPQDFFSNDSHNLVLTVNDKSGRNESAQLYMVAALYKTLSPKYSWGDSISKAKIQKDVVYLPVKKDGKTVDYSFMETYISAIKKQCIARLKHEIDIERGAYNKVLDTLHHESIGTKRSVIEYTVNDEPEMLKAAEDYEYYQWNGANKRVIDFFGDNKTILFGCYKNKKHLEWIQEQGIYNIRLGKRKGTMSGESALFEKTVHLVLYDINYPDKLQVYNIESCCEMSGQQLKELDYPTQRPGKSYMTFKLSISTLDSTQLNNLRLIERITEEHPEHEKGTPVFLEP